MSNRRNRFSLSLVRKNDSLKSPIGNQPRSSSNERDISTHSVCSTPLNTRKRSISLKCSPPVPYECDHSPLPMSQDTSNIISGVSWAWNSPQRVLANDYRHRKKPLSNSNQIKEPESSRMYRRRACDKLTGFYRFQSELKLLQERHEPSEMKKPVSCSSMQLVSPASPQCSPDRGRLFAYKNEDKTSIIARCSVASDSFNKSDLDYLLIQTSQAVDCDESTIDIYDVEKPLSCSSARGELRTSSPPSKGYKLQHRNSLKAKSCESFISENRISPNQSESFNNSNIDKILLQASQAVEQQVNTTVILPKQSNLEQTEKQTAKSKNFFKSRTTDNFESNSDDSFPESELELLLQHAEFPETIQINNESTACIKTPGNNSIVSWKNRNLLTRHKSMPESPSNKMADSRTSRGSNAKWNMQNGSVMFLPNEIDRGTSLEATKTAARKCSKEEIEQKRQEALKRQASRLKRLMQGNHSQSEATLFNSKRT